MQIMGNCSSPSLISSHIVGSMGQSQRCDGARGVRSFKVHGTFPLAKIKGFTFIRGGGGLGARAISKFLHVPFISAG